MGAVRLADLGALTMYHIDWKFIREILFPDLNSLVVRRLLLTLTVLLALWVLRLALKKLVEPLARSRHGRYYLGKVGSYLLLFVAMWGLGRIWFTGIHSLATFLGLISAGVAIAMKDPLMNLAGFFAILIRRPFRIGQRVQIGAHAGDVVDIRSLHFTLLEVGDRSRGEQSTGRLVQVPNGLIFTVPLINFQGGFDYIWNEMILPVPADMDWQTVRETFLGIVTRHAETDEAAIHRQLDSLADEVMIRYQNVLPIVYLSFEEGRAILTARYLCRTRQRRVTESRIWEELLTACPGLAGRS